VIGERFFQVLWFGASNAADECEQRQREQRNVDEVEFVEFREERVGRVRVEEVASDTEPDDVATE
jgi:hypothetical protein